jgi:predicted ATPase
LNLSKIVVTGAPGTGKTSIINLLKAKGYTCFDEFSRTLINWGYNNGIKDFFLEKPNLFSEKILEGRINQFNESKKIKKSKDNLIFFDRSIFDTFAYQKFINKSFVLPNEYDVYKYQKVFILPLWNDIFLNDNERLESFKISRAIHKSIRSTYYHYNYKLNDVSKTSIKNRVDYLLSSCL